MHDFRLIIVSHVVQAGLGESVNWDEIRQLFHLSLDDRPLNDHISNFPICENQETVLYQCSICFILYSELIEGLQDHLKERHDFRVLVCERPGYRFLVHDQETLNDCYSSIYELKTFVCRMKGCHARYVERSEAQALSQPTIKTI